VTADQFQALALSFPGAVDGFNMQSRFVKVNGKDFVRVLAGGMGMLTGIEPDEADLLIEAEPAVFETDAHFKAGRCLRVRLEATTAERMRGFLERRFRQIAKKSVVKAWETSRG
jgi:hypothetical protein